LAGRGHKRGPTMYSGMMLNEMLKAIERERGMTDAPRNRANERSYRTGRGTLTAGAQYMIGGALVRAGRYLQGGTAPRPEPVGP
jgi:hypothetical protein